MNLYTGADSVCCWLQIIIVIGGIPLAWNLAGAIIGYYGYTEDYEVCFERLLREV